MRDEGDKVINDLIASKPMSSREYEYALNKGKSSMLKEKRLMDTFNTHMSFVKG